MKTILLSTLSAFLITILSSGNDEKDLAKTLINYLLPYKDFVHTITTDNGSEFAEHVKITEKLQTPIYFALRL